MRLIICLIILSILFPQHIPSDERGDPDARRIATVNANLVRTTIMNYGISGRQSSNPDQVPYEWPVNSNHHYLAMAALITGSEVQTTGGEIGPLVTLPFRSDASGNSIAWEPVPEYTNPNASSLAVSNDYLTWPECWNNMMEDPEDPGWCGSWNSYFGKNFFVNGVETYSRISDDQNYNEGYTYYPDTTDYSRQGAGLLVDCRTIEWNVPELEDIVFHIFSIKNDGTESLSTNSVGLWIADLVGGDGDSIDDQIGYDLENQLVWSQDADGIGNSEFGSDPVGVVGIQFLETPDNNGLTSVGYDPAGSIPVNNSNQLWNLYLTPGVFTVEPPGGYPPGDYDIFASTGYFSLDPGEIKEFIVAVVMGEDMADMQTNAEAARIFHENGYLQPSQSAILELSLNPEFVYADGLSTTQLSISLRDYFGNGLSDEIVLYIDQNGSVDTTIIWTDEFGEAFVDYSLSEYPENGIVYFTAEIHSPAINFLSAQAELTVLSAEYNNNPDVPVPVALTVESYQQAVKLSWNTESFPETDEENEYLYRIYRNGTLIGESSGVSEMNIDDSYWTNDSLVPFSVNRFYLDATTGYKIPSNYRVVFTDNYDQNTDCYCSYYLFMDPCSPGGNPIYCSATYFASAPIYFYVQKMVGLTGTDLLDWENIPFLFGDFVPSGGNGIFDNTAYDSDWIIFMDAEDEDGNSFPSWSFHLLNAPVGDSQHIYTVPQAGDTAYVSTLYRYVDTEAAEGTNCYYVTRLYPLDTNSEYFEPGTQSEPSAEVCINTIASSGDVNGDETVDVLDIVAIVSYILGWEQPTDDQFFEGDINQDGMLDVLDVIQIVNIVLGNS